MLSKNHSKKIIGVLLALVFVSALYYVYKKNFSGKLLNQLNKNSNQQSTTPLDQNKINSSEPTVEATTENSNDNTIEPADGQRSSEKPDEALRQAIISYMNQNLDKIVPPPVKDKWDIPIFYFVGNSQVYLELYGVDTDLVGLKLLYQVKKEGDNFKLTEEARYKESADDFTLASGQDTFRDYVKEEYDLNEENNKWEKFDEFTESTTVDGGDFSTDSSNSNDNSSPSGTIVE